jgi:WD40 repeat protein
VLREQGGWQNWLDFDASGSRLLGAGEEGVLLWNLESGEPPSRFEAAGLESAEFSPDGSAIVATGRDRKGRVWDARSGVTRFELEFERYQGACAFSPDGLEVVFGGFSPSATHDAASGERRHLLEGQAGRVRGVDYHPGGGQLASASDDGTICIWSRADGSLIRTVEAHGQGLRAIAYSPDGARLASLGSDDRLRIWETGSYELVLSLDWDDGYSLSWSADGARLWITPLLEHVECLDSVPVRERIR